MGPILFLVRVNVKLSLDLNAHVRAQYATISYVFLISLLATRAIWRIK